MIDSALPVPPPRLTFPGWPKTALLIFAALFTIWSLFSLEFSLKKLVIEGLPGIWRIILQGIPPDSSRLLPIARSALQTFQIALVGAGFGILASFPLAVCASRSQTPHPLVRSAATLVIQICRTVPDLVWAILFVASVGLGPFAGVLTIIVDTIGLCGRFFAGAMDEVDRGPQEALSALGSSRLSIVCTVIWPAALPSLINTSLYALEEAVRSSVILGLVGAGGIGLEMTAAMGLGEYQRAATIVLVLLALVNLVEQVNTRLRRKFGETKR